MEEIRANECNLNISLYIGKSIKEETIDIKSVRSEIKVLENQRRETKAKLSDYLQELGFGE